MVSWDIRDELEYCLKLRYLNCAGALHKQTRVLKYEQIP